MLVQVEFVNGSVVEGRQYNRTEQAGFDPAVARKLIDAGIAQRIRGALPLVAAARELADPQIKKLADALANVAPRLAELEGRAEVLREQVSDLERGQARASLMNTLFDASGINQAKVDLADVEQQISLIDDTEGDLHADLQAAVADYVEHAYKKVLDDQVAPVLRAIAAEVTKNRKSFDSLAPARRTIEDLRILGALAEVERGRFDTLESAIVGQIAGSASVGVTGASRVPGNLAALLYAIATYQSAAQQYAAERR
jgi:hypothetical protein